MAESAETMISNPQIDVIVGTSIQISQSSENEGHVIELGDKLVQKNLIEQSGWGKIKDTKGFILVKLLDYIKEQLPRNLNAAEMIMDWMTKFSHGGKEWVNLRKHILFIAIDHLEDKPEYKTIDCSNYKDTFLKHGFEVRENVVSTMFETLYASPGHFEGKSDSEIKRAVRKVLRKCDTPPCQLKECPCNESWFRFWNRNLESGHPFALHYVSDIYKIQIHVVCLLTRKAVCFYPSRDVLESKHIYLGRIGGNKYVSLQPLQSREGVRKGKNEGSKDEEISCMRAENQRLTSKLHDALEENKQLTERIVELENIIEISKHQIPENFRSLHLSHQQSNIDYNSLTEENERLKLKLSKLEKEYNELKANEIIQLNRISILENDRNADRKRIDDLEKRFDQFCNATGNDRKSYFPTQTPTPRTLLPPIDTGLAQEPIDQKVKKKKPTFAKRKALEKKPT